MYNRNSQERQFLFNFFFLSTFKTRDFYSVSLICGAAKLMDFFKNVFAGFFCIDFYWLV